jgi:hypothetical protein
VLVEPEPEPAAAADDAAGDVQEPVAQGFRFCSGEGGLVVQEDRLGPGDQVDGEHDGGQPGRVDREGAGRETAEAGVFAAADAVLDPGVGAVAGIEERELPDRGVGGDALVAPAVVVFEDGQLSAGVAGVPGG